MFIKILYIIPKRSKDSLPRRRCWLPSKMGASNKGRFGTAKSDHSVLRGRCPPLENLPPPLAEYAPPELQTCCPPLVGVQTKKKDTPVPGIPPCPGDNKPKWKNEPCMQVTNQYVMTI